MAQKKAAKPAKKTVKKAAKPAPKAKAKPAAKKPAAKAKAKAKPKPKPVAKKAAPSAKPAAKKPAVKTAAKGKPAVKKVAPKAKPAAKKPVAKATASKKPAATKSAPAPAPSGPLTAADLRRYREQLVKKRQQLVEDLSKNHEANLETSEEGIQDIADKASSAYTREFLLTLSDGERQILQLIDDAMHRMNSGSYAVCVACGGSVSRPRLDAVPWARHCLSCQELQERGLL